MQYSLAYGRGQLDVELPEKNVVKVLKTQSAAAVEEPLDAVFDVLEEPIEAEPLAAIAEGKKSACVVICDTTRPAPNPIVLAPILQTLEDSGIDLPKITILISTGLRRNSTAEERTELIGEDIALRKFKVSDHSARKLHQHEYLGVTKSGKPIWVDRRYLEAEVKVLTGIIEPHPIAGFSGGREAICPGIAASETIAACYSPEQLHHENVRPGNFEDNPIHAEQMEIARKAGCDFIVNVILNQDRQIAKVVGGHLNYAFLEGAAIARKRQTDTVEKQVDIVVTSGGGFPYDKTWYQTMHGIIGALDILKPGGTIIIASACDEGIGGEEFENPGEPFATIDEFIAAVTSSENGETRQSHELQQTLQELSIALHKGRVKVVAKGVTPEMLQKFCVTPSESVESALAEALEEYGPEASIAVIPSGPTVLALAKHKEPYTPVPPKPVPPKPAPPPSEELPEEQPEEPESAETPEPEEPKKTPAKKAAAKKTTVKKAATKKTTAKKTTVKKAAVKKTTEKKATTKKSAKKPAEQNEEPEA